MFFAPNGQTFDGYTSEGFNAYERAQILEMMDNLSDVIGLNFNVVNSAAAADLTLVLDLNEISNEPNPYLGYFNPPGTFNEGIGVFNGDLWDRTAGGDLERGGFGYVTVVHELLHGLGMAHPHDTGGTSNIMSGVSSNFGDYGDFDLNQGIFTVMTYNSGYFTGTAGSAPANPSGGDFGFEGGAMALDIAVLQALYGTNTTHASGNCTSSGFLAPMAA
ncbi:MAG: serralysin [Yoonia sp.]